MQRRMFLALIGTGLAAATAGCSGIEGNGNGQTTEPEPAPINTNPDADGPATAVPTTTTAEPTTATTTLTADQRTVAATGTTRDDGDDGSGNSSSGDVSGTTTSVPKRLAVTERRFYSGQFSTGVRGILKNVSGSPFEYVEIRATFYDAQGTRLDTGIDYDSGLAAGAEWPFDVVYRGPRDPSRIARYTLSVDTSPF